MEFRQLECFLAVSQEKNFTRAAGKLFTSQPAVTAAINNLEKELGVRLFYRTKRFVSLTPEGETFHKHILTLMDNLDETLTHMNEIKEKNAGLLKITVHPCLVDEFFLPAYKMFLKKNPDKKIIFNCSEGLNLIQSVNNNMSSIGITVGQSHEVPKNSQRIYSGNILMLKKNTGCINNLTTTNFFSLNLSTAIAANLEVLLPTLDESCDSLSLLYSINQLLQLPTDNKTRIFIPNFFKHLFTDFTIEDTFDNQINCNLYALYSGNSSKIAVAFIECFHSILSKHMPIE